MGERKGDFQLSLGFIISVVFAIVLLSVAIVWLRGTIGNISGLTDDLTQQAQQALSDTFRSTTTTFSVFPTSYKLAPGKSLIMQGGIKNDAPDGRSHQFVVNVKPESVSSSVCATAFASCAAPDGTPGKTLSQYMQEWATFVSTPQLIQSNQNGFFRIQFSVPSQNVRKGTYIYTVTACYNQNPDVNLDPVSSSPQCTPVSPNIWGGSSQQVLLEVV